MKQIKCFFEKSLRIKRGVTRILAVCCFALSLLTLPAGPKFEQSSSRVDCYDFLEVTLKLDAAGAGNPFTNATFNGEFWSEKGQRLKVDGFCDDGSGKVFKIRFMPSKAGKHEYAVQFQQGTNNLKHSGSFTARKGDIAGPVRVDPHFPFHFIREGDEAHWFWNGTTTYQLLAWDDETIKQAIERLARLGVNRIRVAFCGRTKDGKRWNEPLVVPTDKFRFKMEPWIAARPDSQEDPGYDVTRFNIDFFKKADRMLRLAREKGIIVSVIFYVDGADKGVDPFGKARMGGADEQRYYRYMVARFNAFANIMWDVTNEYHLFRNENWVNQMGALIKQNDPYNHLASVHGNDKFPFRASSWADFAMYQSWDEHGGYEFMLKNREQQKDAGKPMPQINEEYGYEDHYPFPWGEKRLWPSRTGDNRRRLAWEITMAGGYQTTGERANDGTGAGADTGGGWINGRGNEHMTMLIGYRYMKDFFTSFAWWTLEPRKDLVEPGALLLADPGRCYVAYVPKPGQADFFLVQGVYRAKWYNPRTGVWIPLPPVVQLKDGRCVSPRSPDAGDWALLLQRER